MISLLMIAVPELIFCERAAQKSAHTPRAECRGAAAPPDGDNAATYAGSCAERSGTSWSSSTSS